jgi:Cu/Ag efflux protein CusF
MKPAFVLSVLVAVSPIAFAQSGETKGMDMKMDRKEAKGTVHNATGVVTKVAKDKVTIKHEPVPSLNWPSMTMAFKVKDKALLEKMKQNQNVNFDFVQEGRDYVVTAVR